MALKFEITGDNSNLLSSLDGAREGVQRTARDIEESGLSIEDMFKRIGAAAGIAFSLDQAKSFVSKITEVRSFFQDIESSMEVFLGNQQKAAEFTDKLKDYAYYNMFEFKDLADASKQMIAYGHAVDDIIPRLDQLSNIATGTNADLMELVALYNRAKSLGEVGSQSLESWATKGLVVKDVLKEMGQEVDGTTVTFEQLNMVLDKVTGEGGMFHDLMLNQMSNISAEQGQLQDNLDAMYNEIGEKYQDYITGVIKAESWLVDHYKEVGSVILGLVAAYGEYQAALRVTRAIEKSMEKQANEIEATRQAELKEVYDKFSSTEEVTAEEASTAAIIQNTASREGNVTAIDSQIAALERKMIAEIEEQNNVYQTARETLNVLKKQEAQKDSEINTLKKQIDTAKEYIESEKEAMESALKLGDAEEAETIKTNIATESKRLETLQEELGVAQKEKNIIADQRHSQTIATKTALTQKQTTQEKLSNMQKSVSVVQTKAQTTATGLWVAVTKSATAAMNSLKAAIMTNPFGVALAAITTLISLLPIFSDEASKASAEVERFGENAVKQTRNLETLFAVVDNTSKDSKVHKDSVDELCQIYEEYGFHIDDEIDKLEQLKTAHDLVTGAIHREGEERQKANLLQSYNDALEEATTNMRDALQTAFENAEWDNSSDWFDDWDADEYQERAKELTQIIGAIIQSESESFANLTGEELEAKIQEVHERIQKAYTDMGLALQKTFSHGDAGAWASPVDVHDIDIINDYVDAIHSVTQGRNALLKTFDEEKKAHPEIQKDIDYTTMSIADLAKKASEASGEMSDLGDQNVSPEVDKTSIDNATDAAGQAKKGIDLLNGMTAKPLIDTTSIGLAIGQTNILLGNMFQLQSFGMGGGKSSFSLGFNPNKFGFGKTGQFNLFGGKQGVQWMPDIPVSDPALLALQELNKRVNGANSQKKVDDLLKEVNEAFDKATFDSEEYKFLQGLKKRLEAKSRKKGGGKTSKKNGGKTSKKNDTADRTAEEEANRRQEEEANRRQSDFDLYLREKEEQAEQSQATRDAIEQARIARIENDGEREREAEKEQHLLNLRAIDEREKDMKKALYEYNKNVWENRNKNNKLKYSDTEAGKAGWEGLTLTKEQQDELEALREKENSEYSRLLKNREREELQSMRDYLKEYGSFEQQRLAITEEYEEKMAEATTQGEKLRLQKERDQKLGSLNYENIAAGIDWKALFSGVGSLSNEMMQPMMDKLMAYTKTDEYLNADSQTQQSVADIIQEMRQYLGTDQSMTWQALGKATENFMAAVDKYNQAVEDEGAAVKRLDQAKLDLKAGKITQAAFDEIKADADKFGKATQDAKESMEGFGTVLNDTSEQINNYTSKLTAALNNAKGWTGVDGFSGVQSSIGQIDSFKGALDSALPSMGDRIGKSISTGLSSVIGGGLSSLGSGLTSILSSGLGQTIGFVAQIPRLILDLVSNVKQFVTGILDSFTELISLRWIDDLVVSICDAIANLINAIFDLPENLFKVLEGIVVNGIGGLLNNLVGRIGNILSFGALSSGGPAEWFSSSNAKEVAETINRLTEENKDLEQAIDDLKDEMEKSHGISAIEISRRAADLQELTDENYKKMAQAQAGYHGDHHSWNYYWGGYNQEQIDRLSKQIGRQWNGNIWDLSPEEMKMLRSNVDMWNQIKNTGKSYYGSAVQEKLNDYIDQAGKKQEIIDALYENLTTTTKDNVFDDFLNSLYDLADGSEDVFDNIAEEWQMMVNKMVINNLVGDRFKKKLESWYEELAKLNEAKIEGKITDAEYRERLDLLKAQYEDYMKDAERDVETLRNEGIIKASEDSEYKQEASSKGFQAMGQDVGEELNGRFTALQIAGESVAAQVISIYSQMIVISQIQVSSNTYLSEIRNMMIDGNSYLEDIAKYSKKIYIDFATKLDDITTNTK